MPKLYYMQFGESHEAGRLFSSLDAIVRFCKEQWNDDIVWGSWYFDGLRRRVWEPEDNRETMRVTEMEVL